MPRIFPALKEWVRLHKRPGQFLLTGSVRFTSQKSIRESLTGRIVNIELLPMSLSELDQEPPAQALFDLHGRKLFSIRDEEPVADPKRVRQRRLAINSFTKTGGLPGLCFLRDQSLRNARIKTQLETILDRDLRMIYPTRTSFRELLDLTTELARNQGRPLRISDLRRQTGASVRTVQNIVQSLESLFLLRTLKVEGEGRSHVAFFEDPAESSYLCSAELSPAIVNEHLCFLFLRSSFAYRPGVEAQLFQFRTRGGSVVPVAARTAEGVTGCIPIEDSEIPSRKERAAARSFLSAYSQSKILFVTFTGSKRKYIDPRSLLVPIADLTL